MASLFLKSFVCPHCNTKCSFVGDGRGDSVVLWCTGCSKGVYFRLAGYDLPEKYNTTIHIDGDRIVDHYPRIVTNLDPSIPKDVADDFIEATKCIDISAFRATVTQCRRAIQTACVLAGANPKNDLMAQINELESKRVINPGLRDIAHAIRMIGNWGAHPQGDPLKEVTPDDASEVLKFTSEFLDEVFVRPARLKSLKTKKGLK